MPLLSGIFLPITPANRDDSQMGQGLFTGPSLLNPVYFNAITTVCYQAIVLNTDGITKSVDEG